MSIERTFFTGIRWTGFSSLLSLFVGLIQITLLTHYLQKSDFAWVAIAGIFINIGIQLQQTGVNSAIVQHPGLTSIQLSSAYWLNVFIGSFLFFLTIIIGRVLSWIYDTAQLLPIFIVYSLIFLIQAFTIQFKYLLQKNFHFQVLSAGESLGIISSFIFSIITAIAGWGAYALIGSYVIRYMIEGICFVIIGNRHFKPKMELHWDSLKPLLQFGGWHSAERVITHFSSQVDILLIGKFLGMEALGIYDVFKRVLVRPLHLLNEIFEKVIFPIFSKFQKEKLFQKKLYLNLLTNLSAVNFPLITFLAIAATPLVEFVFGAKWVAGVPIFQLLCLFCVWHFLLNPVDTLLLASGKMKLWLIANLIFIPIQVSFLIIGSQFNLFIAVFANVIAYTLFTIGIYFIIIFPQIQSGIFEFIKILLRPFILTLMAALFLLLFRSFFLKMTLFPMTIVFASVYLLLTIFFNRNFINLITSVQKTDSEIRINY